MLSRIRDKNQLLGSGIVYRRKDVRAGQLLPRYKSDRSFLMGSRSMNKKDSCLTSLTLDPAYRLEQLRHRCCRGAVDVSNLPRTVHQVVDVEVTDRVIVFSEP